VVSALLMSPRAMSAATFAANTVATIEIPRTPGRSGHSGRPLF
jgi:hypothetical protein